MKKKNMLVALTTAEDLLKVRRVAKCMTFLIGVLLAVSLQLQGSASSYQGAGNYSEYKDRRDMYAFDKNEREMQQILRNQSQVPNEKFFRINRREWAFRLLDMTPMYSHNWGHHTIEKRYAQLKNFWQRAKSTYHPGIIAYSCSSSLADPNETYSNILNMIDKAYEILLEEETLLNEERKKKEEKEAADATERWREIEQNERTKAGGQPSLASKMGGF